MAPRIPIVSVTFFYLVLQLLVVLRVEGKGVVQNSAEEIAARRARDLLQSTSDLPAVPAPESGGPDRTWLGLSQCHEHCRQCDRYGNCGACKEGYVSIQGDLGLECACADSDCFSCPDNPGVCAVCRDITAEPDSAGKCVCREGLVYDDESGTCLEREEVIGKEPAPEPVLAPVTETVPAPELAPVAEPVPAPELAPVAEPVPAPELAPVAEPVPAPELAPTTPITLTRPNVNVGDPICRDSLCSLCTEGAATCQQCVENAFMNKNGECICDNGFGQMTGISGSSGCLEVPALGDPTCMDGLCSLCPAGTEECQECAKNASMGEDGVCMCDAGFMEMTSLNGFGCMQTRIEGEQPAQTTTPTTPTMPSNGFSVLPQAGSGARDPESGATVTPVLNEKIQALADKFGIVLGDKYDSLVEKKQDASEAIADAIATTAPVAAEIVGNIGAAAANSLPAAAGDGFHYTNIRLESVTPDDFYDPDTGSVFSQQAAYGNDLSTDGGAKGTSKLRDWLANKFNRDDELPDVRAAAPYVSGSASASVSGSASASVSGYTGAPQQPAPPLTPEESFREDLTSKRDLLMGMLKETNDAMRQRMEARRGRADDSTQALLDMLKDVDDELERRIS